MREIKKFGSIGGRLGLEITGDSGPYDGTIGRGSAREVVTFWSEEARDLYIQILQIKDDNAAVHARIQAQDKELVYLKSFRGALANFLRVLRWEIQDFLTAQPRRCGY